MLKRNKRQDMVAAEQSTGCSSTNRLQRTRQSSTTRETSGDIHSNRLSPKSAGNSGNDVDDRKCNNNNNYDDNAWLAETDLELARKDGGPTMSSGADRGQHKQGKLKEGTNKQFQAPLVWTNIWLFVILHSCVPMAVYLLYMGQVSWKTIAFMAFGIYASGLGVTGGTHRLWSHKAYKARLPVELLLMVLQTMAGQNSIYTWCRDHRLHHKFSETDADPHNIKRGFFFAHMGWLCCRKHPEVRAKGQLIDMEDLKQNAVVMFQHRNFWWLTAVFNVLLPTYVPVICWSERPLSGFIFAFMLRYLITLHGTWLVNSAAHYYGDRPYDVQMEARESPYVIYNCLGEGFHNYHHTFPYDYATSEFGRYMNLTTGFIDLCHWLGLVLERRKVEPESILRRRERTGDLSNLVPSHRAGHLSGANGKQLVPSGKRGFLSGQLLGSLRPKSIEELDESRDEPQREQQRGPLAPLNNIIQELPYMSGLTSMKYTM